LPGEAPRFRVVLPNNHLKGRTTVKKLLAMTIVAGIIGLTTGCPANETKPSGAKDGVKPAVKTGGDKDVKKTETHTETTKKEDPATGKKEETKKEDVKKEEPKKEDKPK
jgi:hypothetical protein